MKRGLRGKTRKNKVIYSAKECAYIAVFVALVISAQLAFSGIPGVEIVTVLFVSFAFVFGVAHGMLSATAFSLLRSFVFGVDARTVVLYLIYFNLLTAVFGLLGRRVNRIKRAFVWVVLLACVCTACFTLLDDILTPLWLGYTPKATRLYFKYSLPVMLTQVICTAVTVGTLFLPLRKVFSLFAGKRESEKKIRTE